MSKQGEGLTWTDKKWTIVRADVDLSHVFAPEDTISFKKEGDGYTVVHSGSAPSADCFDGVVLVPVDGEQPPFSDVTPDHPLPLFSKEHADRYKEVATKIEAFTEKNRGVEHLAGVLEMPCHELHEQLADSRKAPHPSRTIETPIRVYQFAGAVTGGRRLLVIRKPLMPSCPGNGNGTVLGYD